MSEPHPSPFPTALVLDTSFLRTVGGPGSDPYQTFVEYVRTNDPELYLSRGVVEELTEQRGYIDVDWVNRADTTESNCRRRCERRTLAEKSSSSPAEFEVSSRPARSTIAVIAEDFGELATRKRRPNHSELPHELGQFPVVRVVGTGHRLA